MSYNPEIPRDRYNNYGDREWTRLSIVLSKILFGFKSRLTHKYFP